MTEIKVQYAGENIITTNGNEVITWAQAEDGTLTVLSHMDSTTNEPYFFDNRTIGKTSADIDIEEPDYYKTPFEEWTAWESLNKPHTAIKYQQFKEEAGDRLTWKSGNKFGLIEVGTPVTASPFQDCYPYVVSSLSKSGKTFKIRQVRATPAEGFDYFGSQEWDIHLDEPFGEEIQARKGKHGWKAGGLRLSIGHASKWENPSF